jgi:hypothetical protein
MFVPGREEGAAAPWIVPDELWARIEPLLPGSSTGGLIIPAAG